MDRLLIISQGPSTIPNQLFPQFTTPQSIEQIKTKYFESDIEVLYDGFSDFSQYTNEICEENAKVLRDVLKLLVVVITDVESIDSNEFIKIFKTFQEDGNDSINLIVFLDTLKVNEIIHQFESELIESHCFWEIITNEEIEYEKFGIDRLREVIHSIPWSSSISTENNSKEKSISDKLDDIIQKNEYHNNLEQNLDDKTDLQNIFNKIQNFKQSIHTFNLSKSDKDEKILNFIEGLNI
ncbi:hypothetical protein WICMUC_001992 [Wickerhamomyces mucosus]|uniref:Increased recombination centers protein 6 n=1 Tax=Wickerhamomyces mucosus TaxID=1378264 RepID=A0A9P8PQH8_9ASCO|nr:hypothetical protein WICMUC_001992 [Wickerhamomyces mucosus]